MREGSARNVSELFWTIVTSPVDKTSENWSTYESFRCIWLIAQEDAPQTGKFFQDVVCKICPIQIKSTSKVPSSQCDDLIYCVRWPVWLRTMWIRRGFESKRLLMSYITGSSFHATSKSRLISLLDTIRNMRFFTLFFSTPSHLLSLSPSLSLSPGASEISREPPRRASIQLSGNFLHFAHKVKHHASWRLTINSGRRTECPDQGKAAYVFQNRR